MQDVSVLASPGVGLALVATLLAVKRSDVVLEPAGQQREMRAPAAYRQLARDWTHRAEGQIQRAGSMPPMGIGHRWSDSHELSSEQEQAIRRSLDILQGKQTQEPVQAASWCQSVRQVWERVGERERKATT